MAQPSPHLYTARGQRAGVPDAVLARAAARIAATELHGAGAILSLGHLARLAGAPYVYLRQIVQRVTDPYVEITRPKKSGGMRILSAPEPVLMDVQRVILRRALRELPQHPASFAYREGRSIVDCARRHVGAKWILKFDLHDFFGQVRERSVYDVFLARGYAPLVALELARICTRARPATHAGTRPGPYTAIPGYSVDGLGTLPQGAPTSGALANAVATPLDAALAEVALVAGLVYTRYSDDLVFSSAAPFDRSTAAATVGLVRKAVATNGFQLHEKKTRVIPPGARHIVLGLLLDGEEVRLLPEFRRRVEVHVRGATKFGLAEHAHHRGFRSLFSFVSHVEGCLAFAVSVEPHWSRRTSENWRAALAASDYPLPP